MSKSYLVTDVSPRAQVALGQFAPHGDTDTKQYGVMFAAVGGQNASHFRQMGEAVNQGIPFGQNQQHRMRWDEFRDRDGKTHDVTLANGTVVRQLIAPREALDRKTQMEADDSTEMCRRENLLSAEQLKAREAANAHASRTIEELSISQQEVQRIPTEHEQMPAASSSAAKASSWTPERRAAAGQRMVAARAAKKSQPATT